MKSSTWGRSCNKVLVLAARADVVFGTASKLVGIVLCHWADTLCDNAVDISCVTLRLHQSLGILWRYKVGHFITELCTTVHPASAAALGGFCCFDLEEGFESACVELTETEALLA